ncbi:hypothetical protein Ahy_B03g066931 [Arachis hypogaea]|uniref:Uncharacterized protein n=1 Tax=Arachis hypogaea TaxID=3818 RepID=A0A445A587_ARAHY|nr:hypothetical protein Ahy_B03g066931 [Arachis hypogaea]
MYRCNPQWGHRGPPRNQYPYYRGRARGYPRGKGGRRNSNQHKKPQVEVSKGATPSVHSRIVFPSDGETCQKGIPFPVKIEKGKAIAQASGIDKNKEVDVDEEYFDEGDDDMIGTISIIPTEYLGEYKGGPNEDYDVEDEEVFSFIQIEDEPGYFLWPTEKQMSRLRPLHITITLSGIKVNKVLIDGGVAISLLPERMLIKVGCYLSSEGISVKLRYPELGFELTGWDFESCSGLDISNICNESNASNLMADLIAEAHCVENRSNVNEINNLVPYISDDIIDFTFDCIYDLEPLGFEKYSVKDDDYYKGFESQDPLEEVNLGTLDNVRITYI